MSVNEFTYGPLTIDEMIKIVSLLEAPPEAAPVRKALHFYEVPADISFEWADSRALMGLLVHYACPQATDELAWMLERLKGKRSLLEVGSSFGGTLKRMAAVMPKGSRIVSVDLACDDTPKYLNPLASLRDTCRKIGLMGGNVELFVGDSHLPSIVEAVRAHGPFEFGFIDGDHSYEGVKLDWENYGPMCKVVAFHDIAAGVDGCRRFWRELKASNQYRTEEYVSTEDNRKFGIGIVYRES